MMGRFVTLFSCTFILLSPVESPAHSGKLDASGCHHSRGTGQYHCHQSIDAAYVGVASVIDGDTIDIHGRRFRLFGIDAPESKQLCDDAKGKTYRCGQVAANTLRDLIERQTVTCEKKDIDRYKRIIAVCSVKGQDMGRYLVSRGMAVAYLYYSRIYAADEMTARLARLGLWQGTFDMPWDWRNAR